MPDIPDRSGPDVDPWLTVQQVSEELKIHPATVRVWIRQGRLNAVRAGKGFRLRRSDVDRALGGEAVPDSGDGQSRSGGAPDAGAFPRPAPRQIAEQIIMIAPTAGGGS